MADSSTVTISFVHVSSFVNYKVNLLWLYIVLPLFAARVRLLLITWSMDLLLDYLTLQLYHFEPYGVSPVGC